MGAKGIEQVEALAKLLEKHQLSEIEIQTRGSKIRVSRGMQAAAQPMQAIAPIAHSVVQAAPSESQDAAAKAASKKAKQVKGHEVKSPMVGTFYASASPDSPSFVKVGQKVKIGDTLCLIEAMKTFNKINAEKAGTVVQCSVEDNMPVEFDQVLFIIE